MRIWFFGLILCSQLLFAQRPIGTWKSFLPFNNAFELAETPDRVYVNSDISIFYVEKSDNSIHTLDKTKGLSDVGIAHLAYNAATKTLVIAYQNSNIDLLVDGETIYNLPDLKNKLTTSSKSINGLYSQGTRMYLSSDIGLSVVDLVAREFKSTFVIGAGGAETPVNNTTISGNSLFAATKEGVKIANANSSNLQNFTSWVTQTNGIPARKASHVASVGAITVAAINDTLYKYDGASWQLLYEQKSWEVKNMRAADNKIWVSMWNDTAGGYQNKWVVFEQNGSFTEKTFDASSRPLDIVVSDNIWIADVWNGLMKYVTPSSNGERFVPNGPLSNGVFNMTIFEGNLYVAAGGVDPNYTTFFSNRDGIVVYKDNQWMLKNGFNGYGQLYNTTDNLTVGVSSITRKAYWGSWGGGLTEMSIDNGNVNVLDNTNSVLENLGGIGVYVSALTSDKEGNVWMMNSSSTKQLKILKPTGDWVIITVPYYIRSTRKMIVDSRGWLWMCQRDGDVIVYNPGNDLDNTADDQWRRLGAGAGNGGLPNNSVWCIVEDKENDIWVGTDEGIGTFFCAGSVFSNNGCGADKIKVERDGFIGYLFSTEIVKSIAVDGANRKWVGTLSGVYLVSADGKKELLNFTTENSPLPSNGITDIRINQATGEVFIGTEEGLVSYQGDAILGKETKSEVLVYPNPVQPTYNGPIAIKGLVDDAYVKITDAAGVLVYQGKANGGQMIWDGKGYEGKRVATGVYVVYAATDAGKEKSVAKIVLLN